jgi:hypothetical protein
MRSARECFELAVKCEQMALASADQVDRPLLLRTAIHWRTLGRLAQPDVPKFSTAWSRVPKIPEG